jgi:steroid 5-alpha reductase family enzyme
MAACLAITFGVSLRLRDNSIADIAYGLAAALATGATYAASPTRHPRETLLLLLVVFWGARLAAHLLVRKRGH